MIRPPFFRGEIEPLGYLDILCGGANIYTLGYLDFGRGCIYTFVDLDFYGGEQFSWL